MASFRWVRQLVCSWGIQIAQLQGFAAWLLASHRMWQYRHLQSRRVFLPVAAWQEWTATSEAAQQRLAQRGVQVASALEALMVADSQQGSSRGEDAPPVGLTAASREVAEQMAGLQALMAAEAGKHRAAFAEALQVGLHAGSASMRIDVVGQPESCVFASIIAECALPTHKCHLGSCTGIVTRS